MNLQSTSSSASPDFDNSYARLPGRFYARQAPTPVAEPTLIKLNEALAHQLQLDPVWLRSEEGTRVLAGNQIPEGAHPLAMAYAGHQFGGWSPQLGDGRALLLGELLDQSGRRFDFQLKGSGRTPFSRSGDGRAWIGPVLREYIVSEAMFALGVPTTRALAAVSTGESVYRETALPGAVLTRIAQSHIRVGTFEYFSARGDTEALALLCDYVLRRHYPELGQTEHSALALLHAVIERQSELVAHWQSLGFIHGVMNTDNVSIVGDTIDYGPCAFMDSYDPAKVFSSIDQQGRYAYQNQPRIAQWNMAVLAQSLLPLMFIQHADNSEEVTVQLAQEAVDKYPALYAEAYLRRMRRKLGLSEEQPDDLELVTELLSIMAEQQADFTQVFRRLSSCLTLPDHSADAELKSLFTNTEDLKPWLIKWKERLQSESSDTQLQQATMLAVNPMFIPRNHRIEEVIQSALKNEWQPLEALCAVLAHPFDDQAQHQGFAAAPTADQLVHATFCGT